MFGRKKQPQSSSGKGKMLMQQMGFYDPEAMQAAALSGGLGDEDDAELEAELLALQQGNSPSPTRKPSPKKRNEGLEAVHALDAMVAQCMKEYNDDDDVSDTDDPDLLAELQDLTTEESSYEPPVKVQSVVPTSTSTSLTSTIEDRINNYQAAFDNAKSAGDSSKSRRAERGLKTLKDLLKKSKAGKPVPEDDIPPPIAVSTNAVKSSVKEPPKEEKPMIFTPTVEPVNTATQEIPTLKDTSKDKAEAKKSSDYVSVSKPQQSKENVLPKPAVQKLPTFQNENDKSTYKLLLEKKQQYVSAALQSKRGGDTLQAAKYLKVSKQFDTVMTALADGKPVDLSQMPPTPPGFKKIEINHVPSVVKVEREVAQAHGDIPNKSTTSVNENEEINLPETSLEEKKKLYQAPESAGSVMEALQQRLAKYKSAETQAQEEGNSSKAKRHGRIVKQYQSAIKAYKMGKPVDFDELPTPPGFPPIPVPGATSAPAPSQPAAVAAATAAATAPVPAAAVSASKPQPAQSRGVKTPPKPGGVQRQASLLSRAEQQTIFLQDRQLQFKKAALKAKQNGDMELAKKYMKSALGFNQMIEASQSGLPVNMEQIPPPPGIRNSESYEFVKSTEEGGKPVGDREEEYKSLEQDLIRQIKMCSNNSQHFTKLGDVSSATKFDKMSLNAKRDLDALKNAYKHGDPVPRFHYETRTFSLVQSCTDLGDNDLEIVIVRGINYHLPGGYQPKDLDTYVKYEFPYPNDEPQKGDTSTCKSTDSPEYNQSFKVEIGRKSRAFQRILKSKSIKMEIYYRRGFLKSDKVLGTVSIKLQPLENNCVVHDSYDLMDGRKAIGGKLEVKLRVRDPFFTKQVEEVKERWLVIDNFDRAVGQMAPPKPAPKIPPRTGKK